jgi:phosphate-selective porin
MNLNDNPGAPGTASVTGVNYRGGEETNTILGVTWYLNSNLKLQAEYNMVDITRLDAAGASLNANFDVIQGRMQFAF